MAPDSKIPRAWNVRRPQGEKIVSKILRFPSSLTLPILALLGAMVVAGCDGGGVPAFVEEPTVSFFADGLEVAPGGAITVALILDKPAPKSLSVRLFAIDDLDEFEFPTSVSISPGQSVAVFTVGARTTVAAESELDLRLLEGFGYTLGADDAVAVTLTDVQLPTVELVGGNQLVSTGANATFSVTRSDLAGEASVNILATPDSAGFSLPPSVTIVEGTGTQVFDVGVTAESGSIEISILPPTGYQLSEPFSATITVAP
jgi:hypothetical protein